MSWLYHVFLKLLNNYNKANSKEKLAYYEEMFNTLYYNYLDALNKHDTNSSIYHNYLEALKSNDHTNSIYTSFLDNMDNEYKKTNPKRIVLDYISLMTDTYF